MSGGRGGAPGWGGGVKQQPGFNPNPFGPGNGVYGGGVKPPFNPTPGVGPTGGYMNPNTGAGAVDPAAGITGWGSNAGGTFSADPSAGNMAGPPPTTAQIPEWWAPGTTPNGQPLPSSPYNMAGKPALTNPDPSLGAGVAPAPGAGLLGGSPFPGGMNGQQYAKFAGQTGGMWDPNNPAGPVPPAVLAAMNSKEPGAVAPSWYNGDALAKNRALQAQVWGVQPGGRLDESSRDTWVQGQVAGKSPQDIQALFTQYQNAYASGDPLAEMRLNAIAAYMGQHGIQYPSGTAGSLPVWGAQGSPGAHNYVPQGGIPGAPGGGRR